MTRFLLMLAAAATATASLFTATVLPAETQRHAPREISRTADGRPILLASMTVTATALPK